MNQRDESREERKTERFCAKANTPRPRSTESDISFMGSLKENHKEFINPGLELQQQLSSVEEPHVSAATLLDSLWLFSAWLKPRAASGWCLEN